jgi:CheY-like chemotaxis protein
MKHLARRAALAVDNARLYAEAQEANRTKDEFLATLSHELRTPLNAIVGWAHLLRKGNLDAETTARAVETIERNTRIQAQLVEDLLDVSRIITGKLRIERRPLELARVIRAALDVVRPAAEAKEIQLEASFDPSVRPVLGDEDRLQQVVWNLLSNAIKFTPRAGRVAVDVLQVDSRVQIRVTDTGRGIRPTFLPHVFERFRQADAATTRDHGGLGLGLAIVRHITELHGGTVSAVSEGEGRGSTFTIELPIHPVAIPAVPRAALDGAGAEPDQRLTGVHVLVVDDEPDARELLGELLRDGGAEVRTAASADEAMTANEAAAPDVLVSDIGMPGQDGYALIRRVKAYERDRGGRIPAVALTAYARDEDRRRALRAGYETHVAKPVDGDELSAAIANLARWRGR